MIIIFLLFSYVFDDISSFHILQYGQNDPKQGNNGYYGYNGKMLIYEKMNHPGIRKYGYVYQNEKSLLIYGGYGLDDDMDGDDEVMMRMVCEFFEWEKEKEEWRMIYECNGKRKEGRSGKEREFDERNEIGVRGMGGYFQIETNERYYVISGVGVNEDSVNVITGDIWEWNMNIYQWRRLQRHKGMWNYGYDDVYSENNQFRDIYKFNVNYNSITNSAYFFGGLRSIGIGLIETMNDLYEYSVDLNMYKFVKGSKVVNDIGNYGEKGKFDVNNIPPSRYGYISFIYKNNLYIMKGSFYVHNDYYSDIWCFNSTNRMFSHVSGDKTRGIVEYEIISNDFDQGNDIGTRVESSFFFNEDYETLVIIGGMYSSGIHKNDIWSFNPSNFAYKYINGSLNDNDVGEYFNNTLLFKSRKGSHVWNDISKKGTLILFGGEDSSSLLLNDMWSYVYISQCNSNGIQYENGTCKCMNNNYFGKDCGSFYCFGILNSNESTCSQNGICVDHDQCKCESGFGYFDCSKKDCFGILQDDNDNVCNNRGKCVESNQCTCESEKILGISCEEIVIKALLLESSIEILMELPYYTLYLNDYLNNFNCSPIIEVVDDLYSLKSGDIECFFEYEKYETSSKLVILLDENHLFKVGDEIIFKSISNSTQSIRLKLNNPDKLLVVSLLIIFSSVFMIIVFILLFFIILFFMKKKNLLLFSKVKPIKKGFGCFIFTDIMSSTKLWRKYGDQMEIALSIHNKLIRKELKKHRGWEVKTIGDSFFCVFPDPLNGIHFAFDVQRVLLDSKIKWPEEFFAEESCIPIRKNGKLIFRGLRVRIGMHWSDDFQLIKENKKYDYFGNSINFAARLESIANGGQIVISSALKKQIQNLLVPHPKWKMRKKKRNNLLNSTAISDTSSTITMSSVKNGNEESMKEVIYYSKVGEFKLKGLENETIVWEILPSDLKERYNQYIEVKKNKPKPPPNRRSFSFSSITLPSLLKFENVLRDKAAIKNDVVFRDINLKMIARRKRGKNGKKRRYKHTKTSKIRMERMRKLKQKNKIKKARGSSINKYGKKGIIGKKKPNSRRKIYPSEKGIKGDINIRKSIKLKNKKMKAKPSKLKPMGGVKRSFGSKSSDQLSKVKSLIENQSGILRKNFSSGNLPSLNNYINNCDVIESKRLPKSSSLKEKGKYIRDMKKRKYRNSTGGGVYSGRSIYVRNMKKRNERYSYSGKTLHQMTNNNTIKLRSFSKLKMTVNKPTRNFKEIEKGNSEIKIINSVEKPKMKD